MILCIIEDLTSTQAANQIILLEARINQLSKILRQQNANFAHFDNYINEQDKKLETLYNLIQILNRSFIAITEKKRKASKNRLRPYAQHC